MRGLRNLGITVELRARMHEKVAIIDGRVLWHGSLNILSHRDTHESMLRIESPAACTQLARFVSTPVRRGDDPPALVATENPECPKCGGPTVWKRGRYGIYFECEAPDCDGKVDPRRRRRSGQMPNGPAGGGARRRSGAPSRGGSGTTTGQACPQPGCDGRLAERYGRYGPFLGCTNYPACRHTEDVNDEAVEIPL